MKDLKELTDKLKKTAHAKSPGLIPRLILITFFRKTGQDFSDGMQNQFLALFGVFEFAL